MTLSEWKDLSLIIGAYITIPSVIIGVVKTFREKTLERRSRIHARQLDALCQLYERLDKVQGYSQLMTKSLSIEGENIEAYPGLLASSMAEARHDFLMARLLLPADIVKAVEDFFKKTSEGQIHHRLAQMTTIEAVQRGNLWSKAGKVAHQEMPALLNTIEQKAREIIHGEGA